MKIVIDDEKIIDLLETEWGYEGIREDVRRLLIENGTPLPEGAEILTKDAYSDLCRRAADVPENARKRTKTHACVCISRQAAIDAITHELSCGAVVDQCGLETAYDLIKELPPVEPERKLGKWLLLSDDEVKKNVGFWPYCSTAWMNYKCSSCGKIVHNSLKGHEENRTRYCHNCGTKMEVNG